MDMMQQWYDRTMGVKRRGGQSVNPSGAGAPMFGIPQTNFNLNHALQGAMGQMAGMNLANQQASMQMRGMNQQHAFRNRLLDVLGGLGAQIGGGGRMTGFQDTNSAQGASLDGSHTTAVTAQPMSQGAMLGTISAMRNPGLQAPQGMGPVGGGGFQATPPGLEPGVQAPRALAQASLLAPRPSDASQHMASLGRTANNQSALSMDRALTPINAQLTQQIDQARAQLGLGNARAMAGLDADNARRNVAFRTPILQALLGLI